VPRVVEFETVTPDTVPAFPEVPTKWTSLPGPFLTALHEAAQVATRDVARLGLSRVQLRGKAGAVAATDGKQLLVQGGFPLPWADDVLVPRVPAFGCPEVTAAKEVAVGRTSTQVAVRAGPWTFLLTIDAHSRYPDITAAMPRSGAVKSRLHLDPGDVAFLLATLPKLPGRDDDHSPVTLDLTTPPAVRARAEGQGPATEAVLTRSTVSGAAVRLHTDRRLLVRALKLGFTEVQVVSSATRSTPCSNSSPTDPTRTARPGFPSRPGAAGKNTRTATQTTHRKSCSTGRKDGRLAFPRPAQTRRRRKRCRRPGPRRLPSAARPRPGGSGGRGAGLCRPPAALSDRPSPLPVR
jgi:hypothetical protein